jgi:hypothetical protein
MLLQTLRSIATIAERAHLLIHWVCSTILRLAYLYYCSSLLRIMRHFEMVVFFLQVVNSAACTNCALQKSLKGRITRVIFV